MAVMINQGKQDTSNDTISFEPFEEKDVVAVVESLKLNEYLPGSFDVTFRLKSGSHKNQTRKDTISYEASSPFSWKYRALRNVCGVPYNQNEPATIDIEGLIKDKILIIDFSIGTKQNGEKRQDFKYRKIDKAHLDVTFPNANEEFAGDDFPFDAKNTGETTVTQTNKAPAPEPKPELKPEPQPIATPSYVSDDDSEWEE
jgi:hypothetical protein